MVAQLAGELVAPYVEKMGEKTGIIDTLAKGISAVIPNSILAAGNSPADNERADQEISNNLKKNIPNFCPKIRQHQYRLRRESIARWRRVINSRALAGVSMWFTLRS